MITASDSFNTIEAERFYVIVPNSGFEPFEDVLARFQAHYNARPVEPGFRYSSDSNSAWLGAAELRELIRRHLEPNL